MFYWAQNTQHKLGVAFSYLERNNGPFDLKWGFLCWKNKGLLNCQMEIDTPSYGVVTSLLVLAWKQN